MHVDTDSIKYKVTIRYGVSTVDMRWFEVPDESDEMTPLYDLLEEHTDA